MIEIEQSLEEIAAPLRSNSMEQEPILDLLVKEKAPVEMSHEGSNLTKDTNENGNT